MAALKGYVSACVPLANPEAATIEQELKLLSNPGTLSGVVSDPEGRPISGVTVFLSCCVSEEPLPGIAPLDSQLGVRLHPAEERNWEIEVSARVVDDQSRVADTLLDATRATVAAVAIKKVNDWVKRLT